MIFLTLFCVFATVQGEIHVLHYTYTYIAHSKPISQPGVYQFAAMEILDDRPIDFSNTKKKPMLHIKILMDRIWMHHNKSDPDVHILQCRYGCRVEKKPDGSLKFLEGFDQYAYDGRDFLSFDTRHMEWVTPFPALPAAESIKKEWEDNPIHSEYTMDRLDTDCVYSLDKFVKYQEQELQTFPPPEVHIFAKKPISPGNSTLVCLATGFFPRDVAVDILKNGMLLIEWDGVTSSGVMPNGDSPETYQLRKWLEIEASDTSKYSCRIQHRTLSSPIEEFLDGKCSNCDSGSTGVGAIVGGIVVLLVIVLVVAAMILFVRHRKMEKENGPPLTVVYSEAKGSLDSVDNDSGKGSSGGFEEAVFLVDNAAPDCITAQNQPLCPVIVNENEFSRSTVDRETTRSTRSSDSASSTSKLLKS